jgi:hypothetical protein
MSTTGLTALVRKVYDDPVMIWHRVSGQGSPLPVLSSRTLIASSVAQSCFWPSG